MTDHSRADLMFRLGLLSLVVPILGPFVWRTSSRALAGESGRSNGANPTPRLVWGRRLGIAATIILLAILTLVLFGGQPVEVP